MPGPGILAGSALLQTELWNYFQFPTETQNGSNAPVQLVQCSGQPRFQGTNAVSFSDVGLESYTSIFLWTRFWLVAHIYVILLLGTHLLLPASLLDLKDHCFISKLILLSHLSSVQFSSVTQSCPSLCDPMNCSTPGLPVHHQLLEFTQTQVHRVSDAIQPSHPLSSPSPPAPNPSQHQSLFQWINSSYEVAKVLEFQL